MISCLGKRIFLFDVKYEYLGPLFKTRHTSLTAYYLENRCRDNDNYGIKPDGFAVLSQMNRLQTIRLKCKFRLSTSNLPLKGNHFLS